MLYQVNTARVSLREYLAGPKSLATLAALPIALLLRLFRVRFTASYDEPPIDEYGPYRVRDGDVEPALLERLLPVENELAELGFHSPVYHAVEDARLAASFRMVTLRHDSGEAIARVQLREWAKPGVPRAEREKLVIWFLSVGADGGEWVTANVGSDFSVPAGRNWKIVRGVSATDLWAEHEGVIEPARLAGSLKPVRAQADLLQVIDAYQRRTVEFQLERGIYVEPSEDAVQTSATEDGQPKIQLADPDAPVLEEIAKSQAASSSWVSAAVLLAASIALFLSLGSAAWSWEFAALLVPILLFHELGHLAAMRLFKYRNLKMFFIPLFGAAVTGRHYNVAGWKKAIVSLAGPVPGIALGGALSIAAMYVDNELLKKAAILALVLNAMNLLPILPLDGGWVAHTLFFSRRPWVDAAFRVLTAGLLLLAAWGMGDRILFGLGVLMAMGIPWAYRLARIAHRLRLEGVDATPTTGDALPLDVTKRVISEVRAASRATLKPKQLAQFSTRVIETLNAKPPGMAATLGLSFIQVGSLVAAAVFGMALFIHGQGGFWNLLSAAAARGVTPIECGSYEQAEGNAAGEVVTVVANLADSESAGEVFRAAVAVAGGAQITRFGSSVLVVIPAGDEAQKARWFEFLEGRTEDVFVSQGDSPAMVTISALAPNNAVAAEIERLGTEYFSGGEAMYLVPPWQPGFALSPEHARSRKTYSRLLRPSIDEPENEPENDEAYANLEEQWDEAARRGDSHRMERIEKQMEAVAEAEEGRRLAALRAEGPESVDLELIDLHEKAQADAARQIDFDTLKPEEVQAKIAENLARRQAWERNVGGRMGQLPLADEKPAAEDLVYAASGGFVTRNGLLVTFHGLSLGRPDVAAPRLLDWMCERGFVDVRYTLMSPMYFDEL